MSRLRDALVAALVMCAAASASAQPTTDLPALLQPIRNALASASVNELPAIGAGIPSEWTVGAEGKMMQVSSGWLTTAIDDAHRHPNEWGTRRAALLARIDAISGEASIRMAPTAPADMERSRTVASNILSRDEFRRYRSESMLAHARRRVTEWLLSLWDRFGAGRIGTKRLATGIAWVTAISALVALTWWLVVSLVRAGGRPGLALSPPAARRRSARAWATQAAASQDPREVVRCGYRAAVATLEEEGMWRHDAARTPREHLRLLPSEHRRQPLFADMSRRFEEVWFAARVPTTDDRNAVIRRLEELGCLRAD